MSTRWLIAIVMIELLAVCWMTAVNARQTRMLAESINRLAQSQQLLATAHELHASDPFAHRDAS